MKGEDIEMKKSITGITITREMMGYPGGIRRETIVFIHRETTNPNEYQTHSYTTNDILKRGNISDSSVRRAKRAQAALVERGQRESEAIE